MNTINFDSFCRLLPEDKIQHVILKHFELHNIPHERYIKVVLRYFIDDYDVVFEKRYSDEDKRLFEADSRLMIGYINEIFFGNQYGGQQ